MTFLLALSLVVMGFLIGSVSGMVGIGGGLLVIPLLTFFYAFSQQKATGTSLAMLLPPIGVFAVLAYAKGDNIDWRFAGLLALGFTFGGYAGAWLVNKGHIHPTAPAHRPWRCCWSTSPPTCFSGLVVVPARRWRLC